MFFSTAEIAAVVQKAYLAKFFERSKAVQKLKQEQFDLIERLKNNIQAGYAEKQKQIPPYQIDLNHLDRQISKILSDVDKFAPKIDALYGQVSQLIANKAPQPEILSRSSKLERAIERAYQAVLQKAATKTISLDTVDGMMSRALADIDIDNSQVQRQRINKIEKFYAQPNQIRQKLEDYETEPLCISHQSVLDFAITFSTAV